MAESCKRTIEITVPAGEVEQETGRVVDSLKARVRLPGFRPGKAPANLIRSRYSDDVREEVIRSLVPKHFHKAAEDQNLRVVGTPDITDVHFHDGEPLTFKAEFEVAPEFELGQYRALEVGYREPHVTDDQVAERLGQLREQKAQFVNEEPRPVADGDFAVVSLDPIEQGDTNLPFQDEVVVEIGSPDTFEAFTLNLRGLTSGDQREFEVAYPEDFGDRKLAGRTVRFRAALKGIRRKELPEVNDEFATELGDFKDLAELREELRKALFREQEYLAQQGAKNKLVDLLVEAHDFPVPEAFVERQIERQVEQYLRSLAAQGVDISSVKLDWNKVRESQRERAVKDVKASMLLDRIAEREAIEVTNEEVDREVQRLARSEKEPPAALRRRLEKEGALGRIAGRIRTEKTLNLLFEHARKTAED